MTREDSRTWRRIRALDPSVGDRASRVLVAATVVHLLANVVHGVAHGRLSIPVPEGTTWVVVVFVGAVPVAGLVALAANRPRTGSVALVVGLLCSLGYTLAFHAVVPGPDNVAGVALAGWGLSFTGSTLVAVVADTVGVVAGVVVLRRGASGGSGGRSRGPATWDRRRG